MSAARSIRTLVQSDGKVEVSTPDLRPGQPVDVTIRLADTEPNGRRSIIDILAECPGGLLFKSAAEVDAHITEERDSWER